MNGVLSIFVRSETVFTGLRMPGQNLTAARPVTTSWPGVVCLERGVNPTPDDLPPPNHFDLIN